MREWNEGIGEVEEREEKGRGKRIEGYGDKRGRRKENERRE
jgi:hypothetical protein